MQRANKYCLAKAMVSKFKRDIQKKSKRDIAKDLKQNKLVVNRERKRLADSLRLQRKTTRELEEEREQLLDTKIQQQQLNATLRQELADAREATSSAIKREDEARILRRHAEAELFRENKYHPLLMSDDYIVEAPGDAFEYRMLQPTVDWDDHNQHGAVKMKIGKVHGQRDQVAFALSRAMLDHSTEPLLYEKILEDLGKDIAAELIRHAREIMRKY